MDPSIIHPWAPATRDVPANAKLKWMTGDLYGECYAPRCTVFKTLSGYGHACICIIEAYGLPSSMRLQHSWHLATRYQELWISATSDPPVRHFHRCWDPWRWCLTLQRSRRVIISCAIKYPKAMLGIMFQTAWQSTASHLGIQIWCRWRPTLLAIAISRICG